MQAVMNVSAAAMLMGGWVGAWIAVGQLLTHSTHSSARHTRAISAVHATANVHGYAAIKSPECCLLITSAKAVMSYPALSVVLFVC